MYYLIYDKLGSDEENEYYYVCNEYGKITSECYNSNLGYVYIYIDHIIKSITLFNILDKYDHELIDNIKKLIDELIVTLDIEDYEWSVD